MPDVPERIELREATLADETLVVSSNGYWVPSDYPVYLSCVTLTLKKMSVKVLVFLGIKKYAYYTFVDQGLKSSPE